MIWYANTATRMISMTMHAETRTIFLEKSALINCLRFLALFALTAALA